jgi:hypothetical protein
VLLVWFKEWLTTCNVPAAAAAAVAMQGQDPLALLLAAREQQFAAAMAAAAADHERAANRLKAAMAATTADERLQVRCGGMLTHRLSQPLHASITSSCLCVPFAYLKTDPKGIRQHTTM